MIRIIQWNIDFISLSYGCGMIENVEKSQNHGSVIGEKSNYRDSYRQTHILETVDLVFDFQSGAKIVQKIN